MFNIRRHPCIHMIDWYMSLAGYDFFLDVCSLDFDLGIQSLFFDSARYELVPNGIIFRCFTAGLTAVIRS